MNWKNRNESNVAIKDLSDERLQILERFLRGGGKLPPNKELVASHWTALRAELDSRHIGVLADVEMGGNFKYTYSTGVNAVFIGSNHEDPSIDITPENQIDSPDTKYTTHVYGSFTKYKKGSHRTRVDNRKITRVYVDEEFKKENKALQSGNDKPQED